ncbi:MAG: metal ABC transporter ATP-binding protein [Bacillota bacterium]|nr:metal ABC transporter ATP-binding protein [Bacillota bacterium]
MYLKCDNLTMGYENTLALKDVSFEVNKGDFLSVLGANGSGKSTLLKSILGLLSVKNGAVTYGEGVKAREIGYLPQQTIVQRDFPATVWEVCLSGALNSRGSLPFYSRKEKEMVTNNMERLGISHLRHKSYRDLSGGQQQRVLLARALCATKKLLLLDEPVTGLDPVITSEFYDVIDRINKEEGIAIIMVTHDMDGALRHSNKILHLDREVVFFGDTKTYTHSKICRIFLGGKCQC